MSRSISFVVDGIPKAKGRPRHTRTGRTYTPKATRDAEQHFRQAALIAIVGEQMMTGPLYVALDFYFPWPKNTPKRTLTKLTYRTKKPDLDNLVKLGLDAMNGIIFKDDSEVAVIISRKFDELQSGTFVEVKELNR